MKEFWTKNKKNLWFWLFLAMAVATAVALPVMSMDAGNSGDEDGFQIIQGRNVVNYFESDGADTTCFTFANLKYSFGAFLPIEILTGLSRYVKFAI